MASIAILCHELDQAIWPRRDGNGYNCPYLIGQMVFNLIQRGHDVEIVHGLKAKNPDPDLAILHVDLTRVPEDYLAYAAGFRNCLNRKIADISKTVISGALLAGRPDWNGPVIVKSNLNCHAGGESAKNARRKGSAPEVRAFPEYAVFNSIQDVPEELTSDASLVIDCFMPEREGDMYAIRHWVFCGDQGHCNRFISPKMIIKGANVVRKDPCAVPEQLHEIRKSLGFDYGKFDFVMHGDDVYLLDANKTPGSPPLLTAGDKAGVSRLVDGFEAMMHRPQKDSTHG
ncbi:hypothetical protein [Arenimonas sp.]|jgi:hypothetical protein|uniref:hypothetical protein n=1 Tax=Arenimonas sp. TaxID=1872635 RepID=UPI0037BEAF0C